MRVFCPNCSEPINITDDLAGKTTTCPLCHSAFTAPALFSASAPTPIPMAPLPPDIIQNTPAPPPPPFTPPPPAAPEPEPILPALDDEPGAARRIGFPISPDALLWIAAACLAVVVFLSLFFSWNGAYPGGHGVYTQGAFKSLFGSINVDEVGDKVFKLNAEKKEPEKPKEGKEPEKTKVRLEDATKSSWLMLLYLPLLFLSAAVAIAAAAFDRLPVKIPTNVRGILQFRSLLVAALAFALTFLLAIQAMRGFGLERALAKEAADESEKVVKREYSESSFATAEIREKSREIIEGSMNGMLAVRQTTALRLVFVLQIVAICAAVLAFLFSRRSNRPPPRFEFAW